MKIIKIWFYTIVLILWMSLIFFFSNQSSVDSDGVSNGLMSKMINFTENIINYEFSEQEIDNIYKYGIVPLRKSAHLFIYFILGILCFNFINCFDLEKRKKFIISLLICILYACSDEIHQLFIIGRSGEIKDVFIDSIGSILGILLTSRIIKRKCDNCGEKNIRNF